MGEPLRLSTGLVVRHDSNNVIRYNVSTGPGSSGAPVFDLNGNLIGIHHASMANDAGITEGEAISLVNIAPLIVETLEVEERKIPVIDSSNEYKQENTIIQTIPVTNEENLRDCIFVSYVHADQGYQNWKDLLLLHLKAISSLQNIKIWDDSRIETGNKWMKEIELALRRTRVAILLVGC